MYINLNPWITTNTECDVNIISIFKIKCYINIFILMFIKISLNINVVLRQLGYICIEMVKIRNQYNQIKNTSSYVSTE